VCAGEVSGGVSSVAGGQDYDFLGREGVLGGDGVQTLVVERLEDGSFLSRNRVLISVFPVSLHFSFLSLLLLPLLFDVQLGFP
jgi:hypothetical protein